MDHERANDAAILIVIHQHQSHIKVLQVLSDLSDSIFMNGSHFNQTRNLLLAIEESEQNFKKLFYEQVPGKTL